MLADFPERALLADEDGVTPLGLSIALRDEELTTAIITSAQMEGAIGRLLTQRSQGHLPLHAATLTGDSTIISALLIANASASAVDGEGRLPLHLAARMGSFDACDLLVERMPWVINQMSYGGLSPLHEAILAGQEPCALHLLSLGASPLQRGAGGNTAVHLAAACKRERHVSHTLPSLPIDAFQPPPPPLFEPPSI